MSTTTATGPAHEPKRIVIVGGVAGGMSAAARARRLDEHVEIIVLEQGAYVSFANCGLPTTCPARSPSETSSSCTLPTRWPSP